MSILHGLCIDYDVLQACSQDSVMSSLDNFFSTRIEEKTTFDTMARNIEYATLTEIIVLILKSHLK